ncbi:MAG: hypothetical protein AAB573_03015 [Patescibacteria group bacterium]
MTARASSPTERTDARRTRAESRDHIVHAFTREPVLRMDLVRQVDQIVNGSRKSGLSLMQQTLASNDRAPRRHYHPISLFKEMLLHFMLIAVGVTTVTIAVPFAFAGFFLAWAVLAAIVAGGIWSIVHAIRTR